MEVNELVERYQSGERIFNQINLYEADLSGLELPEISLQRCDLRDANLEGTNFRLA